MVKKINAKGRENIFLSRVKMSKVLPGARVDVWIATS
jgi:hypothetical protein